MDQHHYHGNLLIIEKHGDYLPFFQMSHREPGEGAPSDHVPLIHDKVMSYNMLCPGSPNGLTYDNGEKYVEERDYSDLNPRAVKNLLLIRRWIENQGLALVQEVSLNIHSYFNEDIVDVLSFAYARTKDCHFYQGTFYSKNYYEEYQEFSRQLQRKIDQVTSSYRSQRGRVLATILKPRTLPSEQIALINLHLAPGGRGEGQQLHFLEYLSTLLEVVHQYIKKHNGRRIIIAGDLNTDPTILQQINLPHNWCGTLVYAPGSCQSYWDGKPHWSTKDIILDVQRE
jgi:hypothetical protein